MPKKNKNALSSTQSEELLKTLKARFEKNMARHKGLEWSKVQAKLEASQEKLWSLAQMAATGGEQEMHSLRTEVLLGDQPAERRGDVVLVALDGSDHSEQAFACKFTFNYY